MRIAFSVFLALHGVAHLVGFAGQWGIGSVPRQTALVGGRMPIGPGAGRFVGVLWLMTALLFAVAATAGIMRAEWWIQVVAVASVVSLVMSILGLPEAKIGLAINVLLLGWVALRLRTV